MAAEADAQNLPKTVHEDFVWPETLEKKPQQQTHDRSETNEEDEAQPAEKTDIQLLLISADPALGVAWTFLSCFGGEVSTGPHRDTKQPPRYWQRR